MINELSREESEKLLQSGRVARLGCIVNGEPYIVPINYDYNDDCIYSHSLPGLKIEALRENPRACVQVDEIETDLRWSSVLAFGNFEEIVEPAERRTALERLLKRYPMLTPIEWSSVENGNSDEVIVFRIKINRVTGVEGH